MTCLPFMRPSSQPPLTSHPRTTGAGVQALNAPRDGVTLLAAAEQVAGGAGQAAGGVDQVMAELPGQFAQLSGALGKLADRA